MVCLCCEYGLLSIWLIKIVSTRLVCSLWYGFLCHHSILLVRWPTKRNGWKHPPTWIISGNCLGYRAFRTNTRRNSTLFSPLSLSSKGINPFPISPRKHRHFFSFSSFVFYSRVAKPWRGEREYLCDMLLQPLFSSGLAECVQYCGLAGSPFHDNVMA